MDMDDTRRETLEPLGGGSWILRNVEHVAGIPDEPETRIWKLRRARRWTPRLCPPGRTLRFPPRVEVPLGRRSSSEVRCSAMRIISSLVAGDALRRKVKTRRSGHPRVTATSTLRRKEFAVFAVRGRVFETAFEHGCGTAKDRQPRVDHLGLDLANVIRGEFAKRSSKHAPELDAGQTSSTDESDDLCEILRDLVGNYGERSRKLKHRRLGWHRPQGTGAGRDRLWRCWPEQGKLRPVADPKPRPDRYRGWLGAIDGNRRRRGKR
jgi:hypothetical protein